jgi:hypothetical protein
MREAKEEIAEENTEILASGKSTSYTLPELFLCADWQAVRPYSLRQLYPRVSMRTQVSIGTHPGIRLCRFHCGDLDLQGKIKGIITQHLVLKYNPLCDDVIIELRREPA